MHRAVVTCVIAFGCYLIVAADSSGCTVPKFSDGEIKELKDGDNYWNWKNFRYERQFIYVKIPVGNILPNGSSVVLSCHRNYSFPGNSGILTSIKCFNGIWLPHPVCLPSYCEEDPPPIMNGKPKTFARRSGSVVDYECDKGYMMVENSSVRCLFGVWKGQLPICRSYDCIVPVLSQGYIKEMKYGNLSWNWVNFRYERQTHYITIPAGRTLRNGSAAIAVCQRDDSFHRKSRNSTELIRCFNGKWQPYPVCPFHDCFVPEIYRGDIKEMKIGNLTWSWKTFRYETEIFYIKIPAGKTVHNGSSVILFCPTEDSFHGKSGTSTRLRCVNGKWHPYPICSLPTRKYDLLFRTQEPYTRTSSMRAEKNTSLVTTSTKAPEMFVTTIHKRISENVYETSTLATEKMPTSKVEIPESECNCEYPISDENLIAYANGKILKFRDKIRNGTIVVFLCKNVGSHQLNGVRYIKCEGCGKWNSSNFPTCSERREGVPGCRVNKAKTADLIVEPMKEYYRLGEFIELSCPFQQKLTTNIERVMCNGRTWSDALPECV